MRHPFARLDVVNLGSGRRSDTERNESSLDDGPDHPDELIAKPFGTNIAFAGLTAAGKTTHAELLAADLGYGYVSAATLLFRELGIPQPRNSRESARLWMSQLHDIEERRGDDEVDDRLEAALLALSREKSHTVFDTWALAWLSSDPIIRIWIESDLPSRSRKCFVSQGEGPEHLPLTDCRRLAHAKDTLSRRRFLRRHQFDLFRDHDHFDIVLDNSSLIPEPTQEAARRGISAFQPILRSAIHLRFEPSAPSGDLLRSPLVLNHVAVPR